MAVRLARATSRFPERAREGAAPSYAADVAHHGPRLPRLDRGHARGDLFPRTTYDRQSWPERDRFILSTGHIRSLGGLAEGGIIRSRSSTATAATKPLDMSTMDRRLGSR